MLVSNNFSTQTSYENQTKKAITNKFIQEAMTDFLRSQLEVYFIENPFDAEKIAGQVLVNKRSPGDGGKDPSEHQEEAVRRRWTSPTGCRSLWTAVPKTCPSGSCILWRATPPWAACKLGRDAEFQGIMPIRGKILNCLKADYAKHLQKRDHHRPFEGHGLRRGGPVQDATRT